MSIAVEIKRSILAEPPRVAHARPTARLMVTYSGPQGAQSVVDELNRVRVSGFAEVTFAVPRGMIPIPSSMRRRGSIPLSGFLQVRELPGVGLFANEAVDLAEAWGADLILVGSQGASSVEPPYFACMSHGVAARARCPVRIARGRALGIGSTPRLLVGIDGSPDADEAVGELARRRWLTGTVVRLVNVRERADDGAVDTHFALLRAESVLRAAGLDVSTEIRHGEPVDELVAAAEDWRANCIVLGSYGLGRGSRISAPRTGLGAVSEALVGRAPFSIEVVRARPVLAARAAIG